MEEFPAVVVLVRYARAGVPSVDEGDAVSTSFDPVINAFADSAWLEQTFGFGGGGCPSLVLVRHCDDMREQISLEPLTIAEFLSRLPSLVQPPSNVLQ